MINYNRHIFDNIDNEEKAYWLGFIVADGYLNLDKHMLRIKLGHKDKQHLIKFINFIGGEESMLKYEIHSITGNKNYYVSFPLCALPAHKEYPCACSRAPQQFL